MDPVASTPPAETPAAPPTPLNGITPPAGLEDPAAMTEPAAEPEKPKTPDEQRMSARFAALSKRERAAVEREKSVKAQEEAFNARAAKFEKVIQAVEKGQENPMAILEAAGITYDQLTRYILQNAPEPEDKVTQLEKRIEAREKEEKEAKLAREKEDLEKQQRYVNDMLDGYRGDLKKHISENPDAYELIIAKGAEDEVFTMIVEHFAQTGEILTPDAAAQKFEGDLEQALTQLLGLKKVASKVAPPAPAKENTPVEAPQKSRAQPVPRTLSTTQVMSDPVTNGQRPMSREERLKAAAGKLQFTDRKP